MRKTKLTEAYKYTVTNRKIISSLKIYSILTNNRNRVINKSQSTIGIQPKASTVSSHKLTNIPTMHFSFSHFKILLIQSINLFTPDNECLSLSRMHSLSMPNGMVPELYSFTNQSILASRIVLRPRL